MNYRDDLNKVKENVRAFIRDIEESNSLEFEAMIREKIREHEELIVGYKQGLSRTCKRELICKTDFGRDWCRATYNIIKDELIPLEQKHIARLKRHIAKAKREDLTEQIERARDYPICELLGEKQSRAGPHREKFICPLHQESGASFTWYRDTNSFYCFGCNKGGDVIALYQLLNKADFKTAVKELSK